MAHYLVRCIVIRANIEGVEKMTYSILKLLSTAHGYHVYRRTWTPVVAESLNNSVIFLLFIVVTLQVQSDTSNNSILIRVCL